MSKNQNQTPKKPAKPNTELLHRGILCALIGVAVLISPNFIQTPAMQDIVAKAELVGWFAVVLGAALVARFAMKRKMGL